MPEGPGGSSGRIAFWLLTFIIIIALMALYLTSMLLATETRDSVTDKMLNWDEDSTLFQYGGFRIFGEGFDVTEEICSETKIQTGEKTFYNASMTIAFEMNLTIDSCRIFVNGTMVDFFNYDKILMTGEWEKYLKEGYPISLGKLSVIQDYKIVLWCDDYRNSRTMKRLCHISKESKTSKE